MTSKIFYTITFFIGLALALWTTYIYRDSFIPIYIPITITLITGVVVTIIKNRKARYSKLYLFKKFLLYSLTLGVIVTSLFFLSNFYFSTKADTTQTFEIQELSTKRGKKYKRKKLRPVVHINYYGDEQTVDFPNKFLNNITYYKKINLTIRKGLWGCDIITGKELIKD